MTRYPAWYFDELHEGSQDFASAAEAAEYDLSRSRPRRDRALLGRLGVRAGQTLIDLGAGTGTLAVEAVQLGAHVYAVDISSAMLAYAQQKAQVVEGGPIEFHRGGFLTYEHQAAPVDVLVTRYALHHLPDFWKMVALLRMAAWLKPGGVLYVADVVYSFAPAAYHEHIEAWIARAAQPAGTGFAPGDFHVHVREEHSTFGWIMEGMLARAGLSVEEVTYRTPEYAEYICIKKGEASPPAPAGQGAAS